MIALAIADWMMIVVWIVAAPTLAFVLVLILLIAPALVLVLVLALALVLVPILLYVASTLLNVSSNHHYLPICNLQKRPLVFSEGVPVVLIDGHLLDLGGGW